MENLNTRPEQESKYEKAKFPAYYVDSASLDAENADKKDFTTTVAVDVFIRDKGAGVGDVVWFDTTKQVGYKVTDLLVDDKTGTIRFSAPQNGFVYSLAPMTTDLYNQHVRQFMADQTPYDSQEDMIRDLLATKDVNGGW